jgi:hypothetical protein
MPYFWDTGRGITVFFKISRKFYREAFNFENRRSEMGKEKLEFTFLSVPLYVNFWDMDRNSLNLYSMSVPEYIM